MGKALKYLLIAMLSSMGLLFVIWFGLLVAEHPNDFYNYHLDLNATFERFISYFDDLQLSVFGKTVNFKGGANNFLSSGISWGSTMIQKATSAVNKGEQFFSTYLNKNPSFDVMMMITGLSLIYYAIFGVIKMLLLLAYILLIGGNVISMCVSFLMAFANAISMPVFVYGGASPSLTSLFI